MYIGLHMKYPLFLSDFNEIRNFSIEFRKIPKYPISLISVQLEPSRSMWAGGRTDRHDEANSRLAQYCEGV
jgi:hypothetical protein